MIGIVLSAFLSLLATPEPAAPGRFALVPAIPSVPLPRDADIGNRKARRRFSKAGW